jgi:alcohol oxidase
MSDCVYRGKRAVGIEYVQNPRQHPNASALEVSIARAKRLVVLGSGAFGSPAILERSGIGAKAVLEKYGVEQLVDLPGVGENYQGILVLC